MKTSECVKTLDEHVDKVSSSLLKRFTVGHDNCIFYVAYII